MTFGHAKTCPCEICAERRVKSHDRYLLWSYRMRNHVPRYMRWIEKMKERKQKQILLGFCLRCPRRQKKGFKQCSVHLRWRRLYHLRTGR